MLIAQPLRIHVGPELELLLFNNQPIGGLTHFELDFQSAQAIHTQYACAGCFPFLLAEAPERSLSNAEFPLRIYVGPPSDETFTDQHLNVWFYGRPLPVRQILVQLHADAKRIIRMYLDTALPSEVLSALLDLGVEVIVDHVQDA